MAIPGMNRIETKDGRAFELTYRQMWEDEAKWMIQPRCKICPDAIGQAADIVASDAWLNGGPAVEDEALNGIFVRTQRGLELYEAAVEAGVLAIKRESSFAEFDVLQSHQVRKRRAVWARLKGMEIAGKPVPAVTDLALGGLCAAEFAAGQSGGSPRRPRPRAARRPRRAAPAGGALVHISSERLPGIPCIPLPGDEHASRLDAIRSTRV